MAFVIQTHGGKPAPEAPQPAFRGGAPAPGGAAPPSADGHGANGLGEGPQARFGQGAVEALRDLVREGAEALRDGAETLARALPPAGDDVAVDEVADFGFLFPPSDDPGDYVAADALAELDQLGTLMVPAGTDPSADPTPESPPGTALPAVMTYWGQFLDHELTARTDRETAMSRIDDPTPLPAPEVEAKLKNARSPRFDLDSVYGGSAVGPGMTPDVARVISGMRHPALRDKMRVGTALTDADGPDNGPLPDDALDPHRDLPRFAQVEPDVRAAYLALAARRLDAADLAAFEASLPSRAIIGDTRNEENLVVAQFHVSVLRFHNRTVDFLRANPTGWIADFRSAQELTRLHYQWLSIERYLKAVCDPAVVERVKDDRARHFFAFRDAYRARNPGRTLGNALPLEFSAAAFRFGHTMVRGVYDYNRNFGRAVPPVVPRIPIAPFNLLFGFTANGGFRPGPAAPPKPKLPANWVIDWSRFLVADDSFPEEPQRTARAIDTLLAPPLGNMVNEGGAFAEGTDLHALFRHLARRNLRRGLSLRLPTGQALHQHLRALGAVQSAPIADVGAAVAGKPELAAFLRGSASRLHERTPLWFYVLAEAEAAGQGRLGELGSWLVASTFVAVMLADPDSALSRGFEPGQSPLRMPDGSPIDTLEKWMRFALVLA
jgi:hypothetical protein